MRRLLTIVVCLCACLMARGQTASYGYRYWFDQNTVVYTGISTAPQWQFDADVSSLKEGMHSLNIQVEHNDTLSAPTSHIFIKAPQIEGIGYMRCLFWVDGALFRDEQVPNTGGTMAWTIDVSSLTEGLHQYMLQAVMPSGVCSDFRQGTFLYTTQASELDNMRCFYMVDDATASTAEATTINNGLYHFDLDVSALSDGLHHLSYWLVGSDGSCTAVKTAYFTKVPLGGSGITQFQYWINEREDQKHTTAFNPRKDTVSIISLLPVETQPIRSKNFQFAIKNGQPLIYAKNEFHILFLDASNRRADVTKEYVDEQVSEQVIPEGELQATQTFPRVAENSIRWYTVNVEPGDTVAFKSSQACTMQLFSPSGEEVYKTSGSTSVTYSGIHIWENGTYYLAVHDVTGSKENIILDYFHAGKYAVLSHSPEEVGVMEGNFYIKLFGNGFDKLTKAQLIDDSNILMADLIQIQNISNATLQFSFAYNNFPRGNFDLVLDFTDENESESITVVDAVNITNPIFGDIMVDVISHPTVAKPYPVTIKIRNTGNVTYQFVPLFFANSINQLESMQLLNFGMQSSKTVMDANIKTFYKVDNFFGEDSCIVVPTVIPVVNPYQSIEYKIGVVTGPHALFNMYAWTETPWSMRGVNIPETRNKGPRRASTTNITCEIDPCELVANIPNSSCVCNVLWGGVSAIANAYGAMNQWRNNQLRNDYGQWYEENGEDWPYADIPVKTPADIIDQVIRECLGELAPENIAQVQDAIEDALNQMRDRDPQQCPPPSPHPINPYMPGDPNDIIGYLSESGTKFIADSVAKVNYTIEFENDTTLATASAHTIVIKDTLDSRYFDLGTFAPTSIRIGERTEFLDGEPNFVRTIDMRPAINAIAQVTGEYDRAKGIATWTFQSLDPMSMEPTDDLMQGILPVNYNGTSGIGEVAFDIGVKPDKGDGTEVNNRACITFDYEEAIMTPTWTNIVDATAPTSHVVDGTVVGDSIVLQLQGEDNLSGIWKYDVYAQQGQGAPWVKVAENVMGTECTVAFYSGIEYGFCAVATDMAGNVEQKTLARDEFGITQYILGDVNDDGNLTMDDIDCLVNIILGKQQYYTALFADVNRDGHITIADVTALVNILVSH